VDRRVILDTNLLIAYERNEFDRTILDDADVAISAITVAEYRTAIELAGSTEQAQARTRALTAIVGAVEVLDYSTSTAIHHARLIAHVRQQGRPRGAHDLIIASHAAETGRTLLSRDVAARFSDLPGVSANSV